MGLNTLSNASIKYNSESARAEETASAPPRFVSNDASNTTSGKLFESLVKYIPTEIITPYLVIVAAAPVLNWNLDTIFRITLILTPIVLVIVHLSKGLESNKPVREIGWRMIPWQMIAAMLAFYIWSLAIPTSDQASTITDPNHTTKLVLQGVLASVASPLLTLFEPIASWISNSVAKRVQSVLPHR